MPVGLRSGTITSPTHRVFRITGGLPEGSATLMMSAEILSERSGVASLPGGLTAFGEAAEEAIVVPLGPLVRVGHASQQRSDDVVELRGGFFVDRLIQVVGGLVIAVAQPVLVDLFFRRTEFIAELEG